MASANLKKYTSEEILNKAFNFGGYSVANVDIPAAGLQPYEVVTTGAREIHLIDNGDLASALTIAFKQEDGTYGPDIALLNAQMPFIWDKMSSDAVRFTGTETESFLVLWFK